MFKLLKWLVLVSLLFVSILIVDKFLLGLPETEPFQGAVSRFYKDFRTRLLTLAIGQPNQDQPNKPMSSSIEGIIEQSRPLGQKTPSEGSSRYIYADRYGELHFAESLEAIPPQHRSEAQVLAE